MTILKSQLNPRSADFLANAAAMTAVVADLHEKVDKVDGSYLYCAFCLILAIAASPRPPSIISRS